MAATNTSPAQPTHPALNVDTVGMQPGSATNPEPNGDDLYPGGVPTPHGMNADAVGRDRPGKTTDSTAGTGTEGEVDVWSSRYSQRNFIGRIGFRVILTVAVAVLAIYTWGFSHIAWKYATWTGLAIVSLLWLSLVYRMFQAYYSHFYRLTNRRLFVSTGIINRRRDMMELLQVKDVFTRQQSLMERWLSLGSVVVVPSEKSQPTFYVTGVDNPKEVMDLIWHYARTERDLRSVKVEEI